MQRLLNIMESATNESFPMDTYTPGNQDQETENVSYSKTKSKGDASVTISANAKSMQDLHDVLKLAGITLPKDKEMSMDEPEADQEVCAQCGDPDCTCPPGECDCGSDEPADIDTRYSTDQQALIDVIRQRLQKRLS